MQRLILAGEAMGLLMAQSEGPLSTVRGYDLAVAGAEYNVAVGVARLGHDVSYMTKLGRDPFGERICAGLKENGIGQELLSWSERRRTGFMLKSRVTKGDPHIFYYRAGSAASTLAAADVGKISFAEYTHLHVTGILPALGDGPREATEAMMDAARRAGLHISFDPNLRPQLWESKEKMVKVLNRLASKADLVLPGVAEGKILVGSDDPKEIHAFYRKQGAKRCITKCGSAGAFWSDGVHEGMEKGVTVRKVVDTVGAGDGFAAGVLTALMEGLPLPKAVQRGNLIGALQVMHRGDNEGLPTRAQLRAFMEQEGIV